MSSSTRSTSTIEDLPPEMINELFKYLHPKDLVACSLVNKRWHLIYSKFKLTRMVPIFSPDSSPSNWYETGIKIEDKEMCLPDFFCDMADQPIVSNLRYLALFANFSLRMDLNKLNQFSQLRHLEFDSYRRWLNREKLHLNLPQLKVLAFHEHNERCPVSVDCPKLELLLYRGEPANSNLLEVKHPETIQKLETDMLGEQLTPFMNVECLVTGRLQVISRTTLLLLPKLKELHLKLNWKPSARLNFNEFLDAKEQLKEFLSDVNLFRDSRNFKFRFAGFNLSQTKLDRMDFTVPIVEGILWSWAWRYMEFYLKNIDLIDPSEPVEFIHPVHYNLLMRHFDGKLPSCFFPKFRGIEHVVTDDKIKDADHFLWFLKSLSSLRMLCLRGSKLGQEFYDQLPMFAHSLARLELVEPGETSLKFDFAHNLPRLSHLRIVFDGPPSLELISSLVGPAGKPVSVEISCLRFNEKGDHCSFLKSRGSIEWSAIRRDSTKQFKTKKPEELLDFFERIKLGSLDSRLEEESRPTKGIFRNVCVIY